MYTVCGCMHTYVHIHLRITDSKGYGKVCLSPQRRSFGSGCSWKDASTNNTSTRDNNRTSTNNRDLPFDGNTDSKRLSGKYYIHNGC